MILEHTGTERLVQYVLYEKPKDHPGKYVLVKWIVIATGKLQRLAPVMIEDDVEIIHQRMCDAGFVWLERYPQDDPVIMGVYV